MDEPEITGMTERAMFCMAPNDSCDESEDLVPIHYKVMDEVTGQCVENKILGWLCKGHALELSMKGSRG